MTPNALEGRRKVVIGLAGAAQAASGGMLATALVVYVGRAGSPLAVSLLATVFFASSMIFAPLWGAVGDLFGRRRALLIGLSVVTSLLTFGFVFVDGIWGMVGLRGLRSVFAVAFAPLVLSLVRSLADENHRGRSVGFVSGTAAAGDVAAQVSVGVLLGVLVPSSLFLLVGAVGLLTTGLLVFLDDPVAKSGSVPSLPDLAAGARVRVFPDADERARLRRAGLGWLYAGLALRHTAIKGIGALLPIYLLVRLDLSTVAMGGLLAIGPAAQVLFMPLVGRLADRGERKRLVVGGVVLSAWYAFVLAGAALPSERVLRTVVAAGGFVLLAGGFSAMDIGAVSVIGDAVPPARETAFVGLRSTASGVGGVLGPTLVGLAATLVGFETAFALAGMLAVAAAAVLVVRLGEPSRTRRPPTHLGTVETNAGLTQLPGTTRGASSEGRADSRSTGEGGADD